MKTCVPSVLITFALVCLAFVQNTQAVVPAPDGGYPGGNTAEGTSALFSLTSGIDDTALGFRALYHNNGNYNTAEGFGALYSNTSGTRNTANGVNALLSNTTGAHNTADGVNTLFSNTSGANNTANGVSALFSNTTGTENTANGVKALYENTTGSDNTANGVNALFHNTTGRDNAADGTSALYYNTTGGNNTADGAGALYYNTTGGNNIAVGNFAGENVTTASNVICIGAVGNNVSDSCYIGNIFNATSSGGIAVSINSNGRLGTMTSSRRFKDEIKPMDKASEAVFALKPVTFRYKKEIDPAGKSQFGLVAEEVEKVNPDLVVRDKEGKPYSVRYDQVNAMLLNEFLKEHKTVQQQQATITELRSTVAQQQKDFQATAAQQQRQIEALTAGLQKVSAQIEVSKPVPQVVNNP